MLERDPLADLVEQKAPASVVFLGPVAETAAASYRSTHAEADITVLDAVEPLRQLAKLPRVELAVVAHALEMMQKRDAQHLLAALRDVHARCLIVAVRLGDNWPGLISHWSEIELLGFGMHASARFERDGRPVGVFEFRLDDYKLNPDWLNARHWAHPELWDIYRW